MLKTCARSVVPGDTVCGQKAGGNSVDMETDNNKWKYYVTCPKCRKILGFPSLASAKKRS